MLTLRTVCCFSRSRTQTSRLGVQRWAVRRSNNFHSSEIYPFTLCMTRYFSYLCFSFFKTWQSQGESNVLSWWPPWRNLVWVFGRDSRYVWEAEGWSQLAEVIFHSLEPTSYRYYTRFVVKMFYFNCNDVDSGELFNPLSVNFWDKFCVTHPPGTSRTDAVQRVPPLVQCSNKSRQAIQPK